MPRVTREQFLAAAINLVGTPYIYGGRGEIENEPGVDCSGLVALAFWRAGDRETARQLAALSAHGMFTALPPGVINPDLDLHGNLYKDLAFYGTPARATHVVILTAGAKDAVISASGGSSEVDTLQEAHEKGAKVMAFSTPNYRKDLIGFRSLSKYFK